MIGPNIREGSTERSKDNNRAGGGERRSGEGNGSKEIGNCKPKSGQKTCLPQAPFAREAIYERISVEHNAT